MENDVTVTFEPEGRKVRVPLGTTVFQAAKKAGVGIRSECGGKGTCGKCKVIVKDGEALSEPTEEERTHLSPSEINCGFRLACRSEILHDVTVVVPPESRVEKRKIQVGGLERIVVLEPALKKIHVSLNKPRLFDFRPDLERLLNGLSQRVPRAGELEVEFEVLRELPSLLRDANWDVTVTVWNDRRVIEVEPDDTSGRLFGLAVDVGTSKIVGHLVDLTTGETLGVGATENPQIMYGEDLMTRLTFATASEENLKKLQEVVVEGINKVLSEACNEARVDPENVYEATVVGNTAMHHLLLRIQPRHLALSPFTPAVKRQVNATAKKLGIGINSRGVITFLPLIAGFVGADAVADVLATGIHESEELSLLVDIGTNTEVFLGNKDDLLCCSCASGPAFEGVHIKHGMKAVTGAIERIRIGPDLEVEYETIGDVKPSGLCGSAVIDIVAEMLKRGIISRQGKFNSKTETRRLRKEGDEKEFVVAWRDETATGREIVVTQKDVGEIQLAKAAIYTGCSLLMKRKNLKERDIDRVFVAGAFGNYINPENAKVAGLIPDVPTDKIRFVGNTAVVGAKMALLSKEARAKADEISRKTRFMELAADPDFSLELANATFIPHRNPARFPSVEKRLKSLRKQST